MYYYPRIPRSFSPAPFTHKLFDNTAMQKIFHPPMTPQPRSPSSTKRKRSYSTAMKSNVQSNAFSMRSRSITKPFQQTSVNRFGLKQTSISKTITPLNKIIIHYMNSEGKSSNSRTHSAIQISLQQYFNKVYFSKLSGLSTLQLYQKLDPYIKQIVLLNEQNINVQESWIPTQYLSITSKQKLLSSIKKLEKMNRKQFIKELIVYYCFTSEKARKQILFSLMADIHLKFKNNVFMDCSFTSYCLLSMKGKVIQDISKISFFTKELIFCNKSSSKQDFNRFRQIDSKTQKHHNLLQVIKNNYRSRVKNISQQHKPQKIKVFERTAQRQTCSKISRRRKMNPQFNNPKSKKDQKQVLITQIKQQYFISTKQATQFVEQFYTLVSINGRYTTYQKSRTDKSIAISIQNFRENCICLKGKQKQNIDNILAHMEFLTEQNIQLNRYIQFRLIVQCLSEPSRVLNFLVKFLGLDIYKQLTKQILTQSFKISLKQYNIPRSNKVIIDILWLQFKRSDLIQYVDDLELLTITRFKQSYIINRPMYILIMNIIFKTSDPLEQAFESL